METPEYYIEFSTSYSGNPIRHIRTSECHTCIFIIGMADFKLLKNCSNVLSVYFFHDSGLSVL